VHIWFQNLTKKVQTKNNIIPNKNSIWVSKNAQFNGDFEPRTFARSILLGEKHTNPTLKNVFLTPYAQESAQNNEESNLQMRLQFYIHLRVRDASFSIKKGQNRTHALIVMKVQRPNLGNRSFCTSRAVHFCILCLYTVKKVSGFPVPGRDVANQTLPGG
jgi:hypothetical protein